MKEINYKEIREMTAEGIIFTDGTVLEFKKCGQMEQWKGCIAVRNIIGKPPYFEFFYPSKEKRLRIRFDGGSETPFHRLYGHIERCGFHSFDLS